MSPTSSRYISLDEPWVLNKISLQDLLSKTEKGLSILEFYQKEQSLDESHKSMLVSIVVESYTSRLKEMSMKEIDLATNAIQSLFPNEEKVSFLHHILYTQNISMLPYIHNLFR